MPFIVATPATLYTAGHRLIDTELQTWYNTLTGLQNNLGIVAAPVTGTANGTGTSGTTEIRDSAIGNYTFMAVAGVRYRVILQGRGLNPSAAGDRFACNIRNGGASSPTTASPLVGNNATFVTSTALRAFACPMNPDFVPGAGVVTLGVFWVGVTVSGTATPTGNFSFYAEAIGTV